MDQRDLPGFEGKGIDREIVRRHPLQHQRARGAIVDIVGDRDDEAQIDGVEFGVAARSRLRVRDTLADGDAADAAADRLHHARAFAAGDER